SAAAVSAAQDGGKHADRPAHLHGSASRAVDGGRRRGQVGTRFAFGRARMDLRLDLLIEQRLRRKPRPPYLQILRGVTDLGGGGVLLRAQWLSDVLAGFAFAAGWMSGIHLAFRALGQRAAPAAA